MRWLAVAALAVIVLAYVVSRIGVDFGSHLLVEREPRTGGPGADIVGDVAVLLFVISLVQLIRLLGRLTAGELFAPSVTRAFRSFAFWMLMSAAVSIVGTPLVGSLSTMGDGTFRLELKIGLRDIMYLVAGLVMFLVARMLDEAARLDTELKEIV